MINNVRQQNIIKVSNFLLHKTPFIILKPNFTSFDSVVPYMASLLQYNLIKVGVHDLGTYIRAEDAIALIKEALLLDIKKDTILWIEDITPVDDKDYFLHSLMELLRKNIHIYAVLTAVKGLCGSLQTPINFIEWDEDIPETKNVLWEYITPNYCSTKIIAPQTLHFRVYTNIVRGIIKEFGNLPLITAITENGRATFDSLISISTLCIKKGMVVQIQTGTRPVEHHNIISHMMDFWSEPINLVSMYEK